MKPVVHMATAKHAPRPEIIWYELASFDKDADLGPVLVSNGPNVTIAEWRKVYKQKYEIDMGPSMGLEPEMEFVRAYWVIGWGDKGQALFLEKDFVVVAWSPIPLPALAGSVTIINPFAVEIKKGNRGLIL